MATADFFIFADILSYSALIASSFRILNSSAEIPSLPLTLLLVGLPKYHLTSHSRMPTWVNDHTIVAIWVIKIFFVKSFCVFFPSLLDLSCFYWFFTISILYCAHFWRKYSFDTCNFFEEISILSFSTVFLCFFTFFIEEGLLVSLCYSPELCIQLGIPSLSSLLFTSLLSSSIHKASSDNHFAFFHLFFFGMLLVTASCTIL